MRTLTQDTPVAGEQGGSLASIVQTGITVAADTPAIGVLERFLGDPALRVLPVLDGQRPVGLISRQTMVEMFSRPFHRDLFGRKSISRFMDTDPIIVDVAIDIDELAERLVSAGLQQMLDGFLLVDGAGRYAGIGNAQTLFSEVTRRKQAHLYRLAHYDALTSLPNRVMFRERLAAALRGDGATQGKTALAMFDIDHFKRINDTLGHPAGDDLLRVVAQRLRSAVRGCDTLARMGGDEFTLVLTDLRHTKDAASIVRKLRECIGEPIVLGDRQARVTISVGIALYPDDAEDMDELVRKADIALYAAKRAGRDTHRYFDKKHEAFDDVQLFMENALRAAIAGEGLYPTFQPLIDARSGTAVGVEALARWHHPSLGMVPPTTFVPLAEDSGLIGPLGALMSRTASALLAAMPGAEHLRLSLNASALEIRHSDFVVTLLDMLEAVGLSPQRVQLEITERLFLDPDNGILATLETLRSSGVRIAIDDFGIGSTSLRLLNQLPVDTLKIDRSFVATADQDRRALALVKAIIDMGHALDLDIVAEGVERETQAALLKTLGCDQLQGYLYCRPVEAPDLVRWLGEATATV